jgi:hypothetical protein
MPFAFLVFPINSGLFQSLNFDTGSISYNSQWSCSEILVLGQQPLKKTGLFDSRPGY